MNKRRTHGPWVSCLALSNYLPSTFDLGGSEMVECEAAWDFSRSPRWLTTEGAPIAALGGHPCSTLENAINPVTFAMAA
jgi:hypothetical protein